MLKIKIKMLRTKNLLMTDYRNCSQIIRGNVVRLDNKVQNYGLILLLRYGRAEEEQEEAGS